MGDRDREFRSKKEGERRDREFDARDHEALIEAVSAMMNRPLTSDERDRVEAYIEDQGIFWDLRQIGRFLGALFTRPELSREGLALDEGFDALERIQSVTDELQREFSTDIAELQAVALGFPPAEVARANFERAQGRNEEVVQAVAGMPAELRNLWIANGSQLDMNGNPLLGDVNGDGFLDAWYADQGQVGIAFATRPEEEDEIEFIGGFTADTLFPSNLGEVDRTIARVQAEGAAEAAAFPGLGDTYAAPGGIPARSELTEYGPPTYITGDQWSQFATKDPAYITMVQNSLVEAGLLRDTDVVDGVWTGDAAKAMNDAMFEANITGGSMDWVDIVKARAEGVASAKARFGSGAGRVVARPRLVLPAFREPDYAQLQVEVRDALRSRLGRDPLDYEMALLAEELNQNYRAEYDAQVAALKQEFHAGNRVLKGGIASGGTVQDVNPRARLLQQIEEKYGAEIELNEDRLAERQNVGNVFNVLTQTSRVLSGGAI